jgi:Receptor family ligand binding region
VIELTDRRTVVLFFKLAKEGMKSVMLFSLFEPSDAISNEFQNEVRLLSRTKFADLYRYAAFENVDPVATGFYESIILYANAVKSVAERGLDWSNTQELLAAMQNVTYASPRGSNITIGIDGDRIMTYAIHDFDIKTESFTVIFFFIFLNFFSKFPSFVASWPSN